MQSMFATLEELREIDMEWLLSLQALAANWGIHKLEPQHKTLWIVQYIYTSQIGYEADKLVCKLSHAPSNSSIDWIFEYL